MCATTADVTDRDGAIEMIKTGAADLGKVQKVLCDVGYTGDNFANSVAEILPGATVEVVKRNELHTFAVLPSVGLSSGLLAGLTNAADYGKTANEN
jgi:transposase